MRARRIRQVLWLASGLVGLGAAYASLSLFRGGPEPLPPLSRPQLEHTQGGERDGEPALEDLRSYSVIWEKGLGRPPAPPAPLVPAPQSSRVKTFPFELLGTFVERDGLSYALVSERSSATHRLVGVNESLGDVKVADVGPGFVVFETGGRSVRLETKPARPGFLKHVREVMPGPGGGALGPAEVGSASGPLGPDRGGRGQQAPGVPGPQQAAPEEVVAVYFSDEEWKGLLSRMRLVPVTSGEEETVTGVQLANVGKAAVFEERDVVLGVGGKTLSHPGPLFRLEDYRDGRGVVSIVIERRGKVLELQCSRR